MARSVLLVACLAAFAGCGGVVHHAGLAWRAGTVELDATGRVRKGRLAEPAWIAGLPLADWIHFHPDGRLRGGRLAADATVAGHALPAGSFLWFDADERLETCWLARSTTLAGLRCRGGPGKTATSFHPDGALAGLFLVEDTVVDGVPCRAGVFSPVRLHPNGRLACCDLAADHVLAGVLRPRGSRVVLDPEGRLVSCQD